MYKYYISDADCIVFDTEEERSEYLVKELVYTNTEREKYVESYRFFTKFSNEERSKRLKALISKKKEFAKKFGFQPEKLLIGEK